MILSFGVPRMPYTEKNPQDFDCVGVVWCGVVWCGCGVGVGVGVVWVWGVFTSEIF